MYSIKDTSFHNEMNKYSIIMPCFNSEEYVTNAIDSVLNQNYQNWELIIINDGSTDSTLKILENYSNKDSRIKIYTKDNGGYASAINFGLKNITGDYFLLMGSDDSLYDNLLSKIEELLATRTPDLIGFRAVKRYPSGKNVLDKITCFEELIYEDNTNIKTFENTYGKSARIFFIRDTAKIYKTSMLGNLEMFGKYGVDADGIFATMFSHKCNSFMLAPINGYLWTIRKGSVSSTLSLDKEYDRQLNWIKYMKFFCELDVDTLSTTEKSYMWGPIKAGYAILAKKKPLEKEDFINQMEIREKALNSMVLAGITIGNNPIKKYMLFNSTYIWGWLMIFRYRLIRPIFLLLLGD